MLKAGKYSPVGSVPQSTAQDAAGLAARGGVSPTSAAFNIIAKRAKTMKPDEFLLWWKRELRTGGELNEYLRVEKARTTQRYRRVARAAQDFKQNNKSEVRKVAEVPARDYFRWLREDPDFWKDNKNLRSLKRDNPDACIYL
jgi:hypothetical protein